MSKKENKKLSDDTKQELRLLYNLCVGDIAFAKSEQWKITNYTVAIYTALFAVWKTIIVDTLNEKYGIEFYVIIILGLFVLFLSSKMILIDQKLLKKSRERIRGITETFSEDFMKIFKPSKLKKHKVKNNTVLFIHFAIIVLSYILLIYALIKVPIKT